MENLEKERSELRKLLATRALEFRQVTLASGKKSDYYLDCKRVSLDPKGLFLISKLFYEQLLKGTFPQAVGGPTLGADPLTAGLILQSHQKNRPVSGFIIRKEPKGHGTQVWVEGLDQLPSNAHVVILEDVVTSGGSSIKAIEKAVQAGLKVDRVLCVVDRQEGGAENLKNAGYVLESLFTAQDLKSYHQQKA